jgi:KDO2-lipid IV(A) lauroyltransferase
VPSNARLAKKVRELRQRQGVAIIEIADGVRGIFRALKSGMVVPILPDRNAKGHGVSVPFFGQETHVWPTPALAFHRVGCPVVPAYVLRQPDGRLCLTFQPALAMQVTADREADIQANTALTMAVLEEQVRACPEQYMWTYQLWRGELSPASTVQQTS